MRNVWGDATRWNAALRVEVAVAQAQAKRGDIPAEAAQAINDLGQRKAVGKVVVQVR